MVSSTKLALPASKAQVIAFKFFIMFYGLLSVRAFMR
jgi:hypothetical protein